MPHTSVRKGKRVVVKLKDGEIFLDKFVERKGRYLVLQDYGRLRGRDLAAMTIYRNQACV